jgi:hypothetical protein
MQTGSNAAVSFDRNRVLDMTGKYNGIFSVDGDPEVASSGMLNNLVVAKSGHFSAKTLNNGNVPAVLTGVVTPAGDVNATNGNLVLTSHLVWTGSENTGERQLSGTVSNTVDGWNATLSAVRMDTGVTYVAGTKDVMSIPATNSPAGSSFATILTSATGRTFKFTLADGRVAALAGIGTSIASNVPVYVRYTDGGAKAVLFGTWNTATNQVTLNWVKTAGGVVNAAGFNIAPTATIEAFTSPGLTGPHTVTISGGGLASDLTFTGVSLGAKSTQAGIGSVTVTVDTNGKATVKFTQGSSKTVLTAVAGVLSSDNYAAGYFLPLPIGSHDSGLITITP